MVLRIRVAYYWTGAVFVAIDVVCGGTGSLVSARMMDGCGVMGGYSQLFTLVWAAVC